MPPVGLTLSRLKGLLVAIAALKTSPLSIDSAAGWPLLGASLAESIFPSHAKVEGSVYPSR
jgi:hypothetical protein